MKCVRPTGLVLVLCTFTLVHTMPPDLSTTARAPPRLDESIKHLSKQLMENGTTSDVVLDVRTPPKIKAHKKKDKTNIFHENSHAGVAIPVDEDAIHMEETTKKLNFYKIEKPTTNSGLSTWILLSGQTATPSSKTPETVVDSEDIKKNLTITLNQNINKINKPLFKKRNTTRKPTTTTTTTIRTASTEALTTKHPKEVTKFTKIKASVLTNALNKKNITLTTPVYKKQDITAISKSTTPKATTVVSSVPTSKSKNITLTTSSSKVLPLEAKDGDIELPTNGTDNKKNKKSSNKRKKNKNRRKRPSSDKSTNSTKVEKIKHKEKPISTQFYNYLSREIMPTVGAGLVGLLVTAGLASYFLYPFGVARRSYEIDRRDKEGSYYYNNEYSGGIAEEEAIGKVIAGMPVNTLFPGTNTYKTPTSRNAYANNVRYRKGDSYGQNSQSIENIQLTPAPGYDSSYSNQQNYLDSYKAYNNDVIEQSKETGYTVADQKFVVGGIRKSQFNFEEVTPVAVPEHGPRKFKRRKRRSTLEENEIDNEINFGYNKKPVKYNKKVTENEVFTTEYYTTEVASKADDLSTFKPTSTTVKVPQRVKSVMDLLKDLFQLKIRLGLQILQNATISISRYVSKVQKRLDDHYRNYTLVNHPVN